MTVAIMARKLAAGQLKPVDINELINVEGRTAASVPLMGSYASCGFPSPADDYLDRPLDFNELLVHNPSATFAVRIAGDSMIDAGMFPGDIAIVDRSLTPSNGCIVLALIEGEFTIKRYSVKGDRYLLTAENKSFPAIELPDSGFEIWGVIKNSIRML